MMVNRAVDKNLSKKKKKKKLRKRNISRVYVPWTQDEIQALKLIIPFFPYPSWKRIADTMRHYQLVHPIRNAGSIKDKVRWLIGSQYLNKSDFGDQGLIYNAFHGPYSSYQSKNPPNPDSSSLPYISPDYFTDIAKYPAHLYKLDNATIRKLHVDGKIQPTSTSTSSSHTIVHPEPAEMVDHFEHSEVNNVPYTYVSDIMSDTLYFNNGPGPQNLNSSIYSN